MSASANRRQAIAAAGAAIVAAPLLRPQGASAVDSGLNAPVITILDHRDCTRYGKEYKGELTGDENDKMIIKLTMEKIRGSENVAARVLAETIGALKK